MTNEEKRMELDCGFEKLFLKDPAAFWKRCTEDVTVFFLERYQQAFRKSGFRLFGRKSHQYTPADFPAVHRKGFQGEEMLVVFLPRPEEMDILFYHMAYGISCINRNDHPQNIRLHLVQYNQLGSPGVIKVDKENRTMVLGTTEEKQNQADMLWRAAFGNQADPVTDTELFVDRSGKPDFYVRKSPHCPKLPEYVEDDGWADPVIAQRVAENFWYGTTIEISSENDARKPEKYTGVTVELNKIPERVCEEIDLSRFAATEDLFGTGLSAEEERRRKAKLAAFHKCSPEDIRLGRGLRGGTYGICKGSGNHFLYEEYDDNHKLVWMESIST